MNLLKKYDVYSDPGHGWVRVKIADLIEMGIADKITAYSYMRGDWAYLEEDADASTFVERWLELTGKTLEDFWKFNRVHSSNDRSRIRKYAGYVPMTTEDLALAARIRVALRARFTGRANEAKIAAADIGWLKNLNERYRLGVS